MAPLRVLYFVHSFDQGGAERQTAELVARLPRDRFAAHVAVCAVREHFEVDAPVLDLRSPSGPEPKTFLALVRVVRRVRPDVVHAVHDPQNSYARLAVRVARRGIAVGSIRCTQLPRRTIRRERVTHRIGGALVVNSRSIRDELVSRAHIAPDRIDVIENGVDGERFRPLDPITRRVARERFGMRGPTFVCAARIATQKNQLAIVRAVGELVARGEWPAGARVIFAGRPEPDARYADEVARAVRSLDARGAVEVIAPVRDVETLLAAADATLLASRYEGLPNAVLESLACGTPAIVSRAANADGAVRDGETGLVTNDFADALGRALRDSRALEAMGARARASTLARFAMTRMVDATCALYERVARAR